MVCSIRTPNIGTITPRATWSILPTTPLPTWTKMLLVQAIIRLTNALRPEGWFPFCGSLLYLYTQSLTDSSKLYLEHGPYFLRYTNLHIWKCSMFKPLSDYLTHCVQKAVFHLMEAYGQYYSYSQSWTHSSNGCLVHGPYFLRYACRHIRKCTMFKPLWDYPTRCVQKPDFNFVKAYCLYYVCTQSWIFSSMGYLVHGPYFLRYTCLHIRTWIMFKPLWNYPTRCVQKTDFIYVPLFPFMYH